MRFAPLLLSVMTACGFIQGELYGSVTADATIDSEIDAIPVVADAAIDGPPPLTLSVEAWMDGRSNLIIKGHTAKWHHFQFAAPGRELYPTVNEPTKFDGVDWMPTWPDQPTGENRDCDCDSSTYMSLPITLPSVPTTTTLTYVARKAPSVLQQPSAANQWTLIIEVTDVGFGGSSTHIVNLSIAYDSL